MHTTLQPILDILDEGLRIYRRGFVGFMLITASWLVPVAMGIGLSIAVVQFWGEFAFFLIILGWTVVLLPLFTYLVGGISRATLDVQQGHAIRLRQALAIPPQRALGMGCYSVILYIVINIVSSAVTMVCFCPLYIVMISFGASIGAVADDTSGLGVAIIIILSVLIGLIFILFYGLALLLSGATYSSLVYGVQPFAQEALSFGNAIQRSIDLIFYRFRSNFFAFILSSTIFGAMSIAVTVAIGVLVPLPLLFALGEESIIAQGVSASAWILGLIVVVPPMPIWMALLYQRNLAAWQGRDLAVRIHGLLPNEVAEA